jgi:hypothetical protein
MVGPEAKAALQAIPPAEGAGLLPGGLPFGLAALARAVRALTEPEAKAGDRGLILLRWLGLCSWLVGAGLGYLVLRRRSRPTAALPGPGTLGATTLREEDLL